MGASSSSARLRRCLPARLRTIRVHEIIASIGVVVGVVSARHGLGDADPGLLAFGLGGLAIRLAIATEWVRCDQSGVSWRSLFVRYAVAWTEITSIDVGA